MEIVPNCRAMLLADEKKKSSEKLRRHTSCLHTAWGKTFSIASISIIFLPTWANPEGWEEGEENQVCHKIPDLLQIFTHFPSTVLLFLFAKSDWCQRFPVHWEDVCNSCLCSTYYCCQSTETSTNIVNFYVNTSSLCQPPPEEIEKRCSDFAKTLGRGRLLRCKSNPRSTW